MKKLLFIIPLLFCLNAFAVTDNNTFVIDQNNDRVGIGTASPTHDLHVAGSVAIDDTLSVSDSIGIKTFNQASEPTTTDLPNGMFCFWTDTDDSKLYICYNHGGTIKTVEMN